MNSVREDWTYRGFATSDATLILEAMIQWLFASLVHGSSMNAPFIPAPRSMPTRPGPFKSNFLSDHRRSPPRSLRLHPHNGTTLTDAPVDQLKPLWKNGLVK